VDLLFAYFGFFLSPDAVNAADCRSETRRRSHREKRLLPDSDLSSAEFGKNPAGLARQKSAELPVEIPPVIPIDGTLFPSVLFRSVHFTFRASKKCH